jgi:hypothetical protein
MGPGCYTSPRTVRVFQLFFHASLFIFFFFTLPHSCLPCATFLHPAHNTLKVRVFHLFIYSSKAAPLFIFFNLHPPSLLSSLRQESKTNIALHHQRWILTAMSPPRTRGSQLIAKLAHSRHTATNIYHNLGGTHDTISIFVSFPFILKPWPESGIPVPPCTTHNHATTL